MKRKNGMPKATIEPRQVVPVPKKPKLHGEKPTLMIYDELEDTDNGGV